MNLWINANWLTIYKTLVCENQEGDFATLSLRGYYPLGKSDTSVWGCIPTKIVEDVKHIGTLIFPIYVVLPTKIVGDVKHDNISKLVNKVAYLLKL